MKITLKYLGVLCVLLTLSVFTLLGCAWHLRNPNEVPAQLKVLYLDPDSIDSHFKVQVINLLESMKITLVKTPAGAPFTLHVYDYHLHHNNPTIASTNVAITYTYILLVTIAITDANGKLVVPPHTIATTRDVTVNTNQIFTINSTSLFQQELQREAINLIYYWLISSKTHRSLISIPEIPPTTASSPLNAESPSQISAPMKTPFSGHL